MQMLNHVDTITLQAVQNKYPLIIIFGIIIVGIIIYMLIDYLLTKRKKEKNKLKQE